jgi:hypothetical protein
VLSQNTEHFPKNDYGTAIANIAGAIVFCRQIQYLQGKTLLIKRIK